REHSSEPGKDNGRSTRDGWHGKAEEINADVIRAVVEHHYFQNLLKEAVEARTQAYLSKWWKRITVVGSLVCLVLGALGVKEYTSLGDKIKETSEQAEKAKNLVAESTKMLDSTTQVVNKSKDLIESSQDYSTRAANITQQTNQLTSFLLDSLKG